MDVGEDNKKSQIDVESNIPNEDLLVATKPEVASRETSKDSTSLSLSPVPRLATTDELVPSPAPSMNSIHANIIQEAKENATEKRKEDEKLGIYKALAIKLKKELVKSREELQRLQVDSQKECNQLRERVKELEESLNFERHNNSNTIATLEAKVKDLRKQLDTSEADLQAVQNDFESYKVKASQIMQESSSMQSNSNKTFEEEKYKQLKSLNELANLEKLNLEAQLKIAMERNKQIEKDSKTFQERLELAQEKVNQIKELQDTCETLSHENFNLKTALKQFRSKLKLSDPIASASNNLREEPQQTIKSASTSSVTGDNVVKKPLDVDISIHSTKKLERLDFTENSPAIDDKSDGNLTRLPSPSASELDKGDSQTNSSSSFDGSTSGYVHIKPATFEIISKSSLLEDAQNQIDNLTKSYLDSENTNSLLSEQVRALKEEIRRMQRGSDRMELADNLEYLKNIVFKFISLDSGQIEQKQRLVPVLSTVLKLSPEETARLNSLTVVDKASMASSFFRL